MARPAQRVPSFAVTAPPLVLRMVSKRPYQLGISIWA
jgi:hypothetical protein